MCGPSCVVGIATGYGLDGSGIESRWGVEIFRTRQDRPWGPPSLLYNGYRVFPGVKSGRGVTLTSHLLLVPWSRKSRAIPLLILWAVRPVQSLSACTVQLYLYSPQYLYSTAIPLLILWAVRPVQSLSACTGVHFTFLLLSSVVFLNTTSTLPYLCLSLRPSVTQYQRLHGFSDYRIFSGICVHLCPAYTSFVIVTFVTSYVA